MATTREQLIAAVWGAEGGDRDMRKQLIYRVRTEVAGRVDQSTLIETTPNVGYTLVNAAPSAPSSWDGPVRTPVHNHRLGRGSLEARHAAGDHSPLEKRCG